MVFVCSTRTKERPSKPTCKVVLLSLFPEVTGAGSLLSGMPLWSQELFLYLEIVDKEILRD